MCRGCRRRAGCCSSRLPGRRCCRTGAVGAGCIAAVGGCTEAVAGCTGAVGCYTGAAADRRTGRIAATRRKLVS